jgi:hypothetical protein
MKEAATIQATGLVSSINQLPIDPALSLIPFRVVGDRVLIEAIPSDPAFLKLQIKQEKEGLSSEEKKEMEQLSEVAIVKPVGFQEKYMFGIIKCIPAGEYGVEVPAIVTLGLKVCYWHQQKIDIIVDGKPYDMVRVSDVWGIP